MAILMQRTHYHVLPKALVCVCVCVCVCVQGTAIGVQVKTQVGLFNKVAEQSQEYWTTPRSVEREVER
jgi:hypothetical protein